MDLINNNISRYVQEECANRLYRVYIYSNNADDGEYWISYCLLNWVVLMLLDRVWVKEPDGLREEALLKSLPSCSGSVCQMAVKRKDGYRGDLSPWWFLQLCFCSVWGRCPAERGEQTLRYAQLSARFSAELCSPGLWRYYTTLRWVNKLSMAPE